MMKFCLYVMCCIFSSTALALPTLALAADPAPLFTATQADAELAVSQALTEKGAGQKISASMGGRKTDMLFSSPRPITIDVRGLAFDKASNRWSANLFAMAEGNVVSAVPATGRFDETMEIPVLKRAIRNGETISQSDVEIRDFPVAHLRSDTVNDVASLVGKSPLRGISPLRPIRAHEIAEPSLVKKNGMVQMRYATPGMLITASGQAMEDGALGTTIAVRNLASKKIIRAVVENANTVTVNPAGNATEALNQPEGERHAAN